MRADGGRGRTTSGARQAATLFLVVGAIGLVNNAVPGGIGYGDALAIASTLANLVVGSVSLVVPWHRWHPRVTLVLPCVALANLSFDIWRDVFPPSTYGVWLVLVFVWVGQWQPPRTSLLLGPVAAAAYLLPFTGSAPHAEGALVGVLLSIPLAVLVGETIGRKEAATQVAHAAQERAIADLAAANFTDDLTGLGNRRLADAMLDSLAPGDAVAMLDLDHFKEVNDEFGHQRGDELLHHLGEHLRVAVRGGDTVARFGGEEFVVVLRGAAPGARASIERLLDGWRATAPLATLSAGLAVHVEGRSVSETLADADAALYVAKHAGRDRLVVHGEVPVSRAAR